MARSFIISEGEDLISDSGTVLWSLVVGEQLEYPITLNFVEDVTENYTYEAKIIEANNESGQLNAPVNIRNNGTVTDINVRVPIKRGNWDAAQAYNKEEVVIYQGKPYKLLGGVARTNNLLPTQDSMWEETSLSKIYLQFPKSLGDTWSVKPGIGYAVYGFFELRVTEPPDYIFTRTWKPIRGMVQLQYSPTYSVGD